MKAETWLPILPLAQAELGTVPDWLAAVGTFLAFAVALRLLFKELAARREVEEDRRREQASRVAIWTQSVPAPGPSATYAIVMNNSSEEPVSAITFVMYHPDEPERVIREDSWDLLPPGRHPGPATTETYLPGPIRLSFTDAAGRRWTRYPNGRLVERDRPRHRSRKDYMNAWIAGELDHLDY
jgi:hypothetical protein